LIINNTVDDDLVKLAETSIGFYEGQQFSVAGKTLCWDAENAVITGKTQLLFNLKKKKVLVVATSHGNVHWLFGDLPDNEDGAVSGFAQALGTLEETLKCTFVGVVLDACWSATEVHESQAAKEAYCPARLLSGAITLPVFGFDGKASSGTISYYDEDHQKQIKHYAEGCAIFKKGKLVSEKGNEQIWHNGEYLQRQKYYQTLFHVRPAEDGYFRSQ
jgi:hypothetical protein